MTTSPTHKAATRLNRAFRFDDHAIAQPEEFIRLLFNLDLGPLDDGLGFPFDQRMRPETSEPPSLEVELFMATIADRGEAYHISMVKQGYYPLSPLQLAQFINKWPGILDEYRHVGVGYSYSPYGTNGVLVVAERKAQMVKHLTVLYQGEASRLGTIVIPAVRMLN